MSRYTAAFLVFCTALVVGFQLSPAMTSAMVNVIVPAGSRSSLVQTFRIGSPNFLLVWAFFPPVLLTGVSLLIPRHWKIALAGVCLSVAAMGSMLAFERIMFAREARMTTAALPYFPGVNGSTISAESLNLNRIAGVGLAVFFGSVVLLRRRTAKDG